MYFWRKATNRCRKFKFWHFWERPLYGISEYAFKYWCPKYIIYIYPPSLLRVPLRVLWWYSTCIILLFLSLKVILAWKLSMLELQTFGIQLLIFTLALILIPWVWVNLSQLFILVSIIFHLLCTCNIVYSYHVFCKFCLVMYP